MTHHPILDASHIFPKGKYDQSRFLIDNVILGLDHGTGHLIEITPQKRNASTSVRVDSKKLPRHP
jgi:hypothetical protein